MFAFSEFPRQPRFDCDDLWFPGEMNVDKGPGPGGFIKNPTGARELKPRSYISWALPHTEHLYPLYRHYEGGTSCLRCAVIRAFLSRKHFHYFRGKEKWGKWRMKWWNSWNSIDGMWIKSVVKTRFLVLLELVEFEFHCVVSYNFDLIFVFKFWGVIWWELEKMH